MRFTIFNKAWHRTFSTRPLTNTHDWPAASASEATALRRYTNQIIIIIIIIIKQLYLNTHILRKQTNKVIDTDKKHDWT